MQDQACSERKKGAKIRNILRNVELSFRIQILIFSSRLQLRRFRGLAPDAARFWREKKFSRRKDAPKFLSKKMILFLMQKKMVCFQRDSVAALLDG